MKRLLNPTVALITFSVGMITASIWQMNSLWNSTVDATAPSIEPLALSPDAETEKYTVYSAVIRDMYVEDFIQLLVIKHEHDCEVPSPQQEGSLLPDSEQWAIKQMPGLKGETIDDFQSKPRRCNSLTSKLDIPISYELVDDRELEKLFRDRSWTGFNARYPSSSGIIILSTIGFNREMDQAFLYTARGCGGLCGAGYYVLLTKDDRGWKVQKKINVWVS
jgi:hypothetical protein